MIARVQPYDKFFRGNLETSRERFRKKYKFEYNDKIKVDGEILRLLDEVNRFLIPNKQVTLPVELVIALTLRRGFARGRGRSKRMSGDERNMVAAIYDAKRLILKYREQMPRFTRKAIKEKAIADAAKMNFVSPATLTEELKHPKKHREREARLKGGTPS